MLTDHILKLLSGSNVSEYGSNICQIMYDKIIKNIALFEMFVGICQNNNCDTEECDVQQVLLTVIDKVVVIETLYTDILKTVLLVLLKQFTRDMLMSLKVQKNGT